MKYGQWRRGSSHPAPVGQPDYYKRELAPTLLIRSSGNLPVRSFIDSNHQEPQVMDVARACHQKYGVYPLNFSFPRPALMPTSQSDRPHFLSSTIPGEPFSFSDWDAYLAEYQSSYAALSTKKGGWDTFRHLEILFSGTIPLMPGLAQAHPFALAHYPRKALVSVYDSLVHDGPAIPDVETREFFAHYAQSHLTTEAMGQFFLDAAGIRNESIYFLDQKLPRRADYLSAFTLIGLMQLRGSAVIPAFVPEYLFDDYAGDTHKLYGKGFGYSLSLPSTLRPSPSHDVAEVLTQASDFDRIVIGNYDGNQELVAGLLEAGIDASRVVCIVGSDLPPDRRLLRDIKHSGMTFFVREFGSF